MQQLVQWATQQQKTNQAVMSTVPTSQPRPIYTEQVFPAGVRSNISTQHRIPQGTSLINGNKVLLIGTA